jgi:hypothetical protein
MGTGTIKKRARRAIKKRDHAHMLGLERRIKLLALIKDHVIIPASHLLESELAREFLYANPAIVERGVLVAAMQAARPATSPSSVGPRSRARSARRRGSSGSPSCSRSRSSRRGGRCAGRA